MSCSTEVINAVGMIEPCGQLVVGWALDLTGVSEPHIYHACVAHSEALQEDTARLLLDLVTSDPAVYGPPIGRPLDQNVERPRELVRAWLEGRGCAL